jgi:short-subunit dehydrogenase
MKLGGALVTGASGGLGAALADELARRGHPLILTARNLPALDAVACRIREAHDVEVIVQPSDLSKSQGVTDLVAALDAQNVRPSILVNNAGSGLNERFEQHGLERIEAMLHLNIQALSALTHVYAQRMKADGGGHILLVASLAAHMPVPLMAAYGASKAYVLSLGEALHVELGPQVGVTVLSPGYMETGFDDASGFRPNAATKRTALAPSTVARVGLDAMFDGKASVVAGSANKVAAVLARIVPRTFLARQYYKSAAERFREG